jgi:crotonobetainyl-CoA:carnitine CoA-transferase CaiB-like acyl-CoA transferase
MFPLPLEGIRVTDFTNVYAGPYATMILADFGAEVIRVESLHYFPRRHARIRAPSVPRTYGYWLSCGRGICGSHAWGASVESPRYV